jgi:hypothetical protein
MIPRTARVADGWRKVLVLPVLLLGFATAFGVAEAGAEPMPAGVPGNWQLIFNEEFSGNGLNTSIWSPGWQHGSGVSGPMAESCVSSSNVSQPGNGYLYLELSATKSECGGIKTDTGGLVESNPADGVAGHRGFSYLYGYVEWRVWIPGVEPSGAGCPKKGCLPDFPALWSLPGTHNSEIDTMEGLGAKGEACFHLPPPFGKSAPGACTSGTHAGAWHTYGADWEPGVVTYYYDGVKVGELTSSEINEPQYLVMDMVNATDGQPVVLGDTMTVDYVRVWQHPPASTSSNWATVSPENNNINAFYENTSGQLDDEYLVTGGPWSNTVLASNDAGTPSAIESRQNNNINAFYRNTSGQLDDEYSTNGPWANLVLESNDAGTPSAIENAECTNINVFYENTSDQLDAEYTVNGGPWSNLVLAGSDYGQPAAIENSESTNINVFYHSTDNRLADEYAVGSEWKNTVLASNDAGPPAAIENAAGTNINVFYRNTSGQLDDEYALDGEWKNTVLANEMGGGETIPPSATENTSMNVFYENTSGQLADESAGSSWLTPFVLSNGVGGPIASIENVEGTSVNVFDRNLSSELVNDYWVSGEGWKSEILTGGV